MASSLPPSSPHAVAGLLAAAGGGLRLGGLPKAFLRHRGRTMLEHGADYLGQAAGQLFVGLPPERLDEGRALLEGTGAVCLPGGATKQETIGILLQHCRAEFVIVHDVCQFMPPSGMLERVLGGLQGADAVAPVVPLRVRGSLAIRDRDGWMQGAVDRDHAVMSHTPQAYRRSILAAALDHARLEGWVQSGIYALVHRHGGRVRLIDGDPDQLKLTYPEDLAVLEQT